MLAVQHVVLLMHHSSLPLLLSLFSLLLPIIALFAPSSGQHCGGDGSVVTSCISSRRADGLFSCTFCNSWRVTMYMHDAQMCSSMHVATGAPDRFFIFHGAHSYFVLQNCSAVSRVESCLFSELFTCRTEPQSFLLTVPLYARTILCSSELFPFKFSHNSFPSNCSPLRQDDTLLLRTVPL